MAPVSTIRDMDLDGGIACLDFVNSGLNTNKDDVVERLHNYRDLLTLAARVSLLDKKVLKQLTAEAEKHPREAQAIWEKALQVRRYMQEIFGCIADRQVPRIEPALLSQFNAFVAAAVSKQAFTVNKGVLVLSMPSLQNELTQPLDAFILSAYDLLLKENQQYIKRCGRCQWLFLDKTKSHRRKWCNMQECGSIVKSSLYYKRKKSKSL